MKEGCCQRGGSSADAVGDEGGWGSAPPEHYSFSHNLLCNTGWNTQSAEYDMNGELLRENKNLVTNRKERKGDAITRHLQNPAQFQMLGVQCKNHCGIWI